MEQYKRCTGCGETKPLAAYAQRTDRASLKARCKSCYSEYDKRRYAEKGYSRTEARARYLARREELIEYSLQWARQNPEKRLLAKAKRRANTPKSNVSVEQLASRIQVFGGRCWICNGPYEHLDHVKPISKGGAHLAANLRPSCAKCNRAKSARWYGVAGIPKLVEEVLSSHRGTTTKS